MMHHWIWGYSMYSQTNFKSSGYMIVCPQTDALLTAGWSQPSQWWLCPRATHLGHWFFHWNLSPPKCYYLWLPKTTETVMIVWVLHLDPAQTSEIWQKGVPRGHDVFWILCSAMVTIWHRSFEQPESDDKLTGPGGHSIGAQVGLGSLLTFFSFNPRTQPKLRFDIATLDSSARKSPTISARARQRSPKIEIGPHQSYHFLDVNWTMGDHPVQDWFVLAHLTVLDIVGDGLEYC